MSSHPDHCSCREHPLPAAMLVREARARYLEENGFTLEAYDARWTPASLLGIPLAVPNTAAHRRGIMQHDLHHVATGFGTDLVGEGEISAWEIHGSLTGLGFYVGSLVALGTATGLLVSPRRSLAARLASAGKNLFAISEERYQQILEMTVGELRALLGIPTEGAATSARKLHSLAPNR